MSETVTLSSVQSIRPEVINTVRMVGRICQYQGETFKIYSVEGPDWYAFGSKVTGDQSITIDLDMAHSWRTGTYLYLVPQGQTVGDGNGFEVPYESVTLGVTLSKRHELVRAGH